MNNPHLSLPLGECISLFGGGTPSKQIPEYWNGKIPWASVKDLKSTTLKHTEDAITELGLQNSASKLVNSGTIIIATRMAVGKVAITNIDVAINQDLKAIVCKENIDVKYLFYFLSSSENEFNKVSSGATVKGIKLNHILDLKIPLPPLAEQKQIATILDAADSLRQKDQQLVEHYTALSQSLFLDMFGDPVTNQMDWEFIEISRLIKDKASNGFFAKKNDYTASGVPIVWITDFINRVYVQIDGLRTVNIQREDVAKYKLEYGDALFCRSSLSIEGIGKCAIVPKNISDEVLFECHIIKIRFNNRVVPEYFRFLSNTSYFRGKIMQSAKTSTMTTISQEGITKIRIPVPPIQLQSQFAERIALIEQQKQQAQANLEKSEALFNSLLQRAFTGELTANKAA